MRRLLTFVVLAGCHASALTPCPSTPIVAPVTASIVASAKPVPSASAPVVAAPPPTCPSKLFEAKPAVVRYGSMAEAAKKLSSTLANHPTDLKDHAKQYGDTFFFEIPYGYYHESSTLRAFVAAVIVVSPKVIAIPGLFEVAHPMPGPCGNGRRSEGLDIAVDQGIAHVRVLRDAVNDVPTLPPVKYTSQQPNCDSTLTYRIEDHFVDVKSGEHLLALGQSFVGPVYESGAVPGVPFDAFKMVDGRLEAGECSWFWND